MVSERLAKDFTPLPPPLTTGLSSHSMCCGSAVYAYASPQFLIQWISRRGAWLLDSLTKAFESTPVVRHTHGRNAGGAHLEPEIHTYAKAWGLLFMNVSGFTAVAPNIDSMVLDAALR
ncbi:hypothetical protein PHMEG_00018336 [Phytophthora megakarya]|uniref:Uncharacterized protein n=1 Tax=Phytophthora megakarya TaxID=4795 RepID=A0A225VUK9_9STRA|nr:hypothetical protein PHMEG_00018336 [Phytophthora megakarya]